MYKAIDIAKYFITSEPEKYNDKLIVRNKAEFYEGNARLNKYLQLSQILYYVKYKTQLLEDDIRAYANGAVILNVMHNYRKLISDKSQPDITLSATDKSFLDKFMKMMTDSDIDDLIDISHEDVAWEEAWCKGNYHIMHSHSFRRKYEEQYEGALLVLEHMN